MIVVKDNDSLLKAIKLSEKEKIEIQIVNDLTFKNDTIDINKSKGISFTGPATLYGLSLRFENISHSITFENLRMRVGSLFLKEDQPRDCIYFKKCKKINLINCSFTDSSDEVLSFDKCERIEIYRCIIGDPLHIPKTSNGKFIHPDTKKGESHGYGLRCGSANRLKITECLFINCSDRNPQINNKGMVKGEEYKTTIKKCILFNYGNGITFNYKDEDDEKGLFIIKMKENTFIPSFRTKKSDFCIELEKPKKLTLEVEDIDNYCKFYSGYNTIINGKEKVIKNGKEIKFDLSNIGCFPDDYLDTKLKQSVLFPNKHTPDGYDKKPEKWVESGWKS